MDSKKSISVSVVICTRNRVDSLRRCVQALASVITSHKWELVIVDNNSTDNTGTFLASLPKQLNTASIVTAFEAKRGLGAARNEGVRKAQGDIIAFTDDDCYVSEDYIDAMISAFQDRPDAAFIAGRILLYDKNDLRITIQESKDLLILPPRTFVAAGVIQGANMAFRKDALKTIGGFNENFGAGTKFPCEDIDAAASALWSGFSGVYDPRPTVYHHHGRRTATEKRIIMRTYAWARGAYYAKFILRQDSRSIYLRAWMRTLVEQLHYWSPPLAAQIFLCELWGASQYAIAHLSKRI